MERDSIETPLSEKNSKKDKSRWRTQKPREKNELIGDDSARHSRYAEDHTETNQKTACKSDGEYMKPRQRQVVVRCGNRSDIHNARTRAILCPRCCLHGSWICIDDDQSELSRCMVYKIFYNNSSSSSKRHVRKQRPSFWILSNHTGSLLYLTLYVSIYMYI